MLVSFGTVRGELPNLREALGTKVRAGSDEGFG